MREKRSRAWKLGYDDGRAAAITRQKYHENGVLSKSKLNNKDRMDGYWTGYKDNGGK